MGIHRGIEGGLRFHDARPVADSAFDRIWYYALMVGDAGRPSASVYLQSAGLESGGLVEAMGAILLHP